MQSVTEFQEASKKVASDFINGLGTINELTQKLAEQQSLSEDSIRTLVRMSNVEAFDLKRVKMAAEKGESLNIEFVVGNPEDVIMAIREKNAEAFSGNTNTGYNKQSDFFGSLPVSGDSMSVKVAAETKFSFDTEFKSADVAKSQVITAIRSQGDTIKIAKVQFENSVEKVINTLKYTNVNYTSVMKLASLTLGEEADSLLMLIDEQFKGTSELNSDLPLFKCAGLVDTSKTTANESKAVGLIKEAFEYTKTIRKINDNLLALDSLLKMVK